MLLSRTVTATAGALAGQSGMLIAVASCEILNSAGVRLPASAAASSVARDSCCRRAMAMSSVITEVWELKTKKPGYFRSRLARLRGADFEMAFSNDIYRAGVINTFGSAFALACGALKEVMMLHGAEVPEDSSPRALLKLGYRLGFVDDPEVWLEMLKHPVCEDILLDDDRADTLLLLIRDSFIRALSALERTLEEKLEECGGEGEVTAVEYGKGAPRHRSGCAQ